MAIEQREVALVPGDTVVIFSDGLSESQNESGEEFGDERLVSLLPRLPLTSTEDFCKAVLETVESFARGCKQADDMTLIVATVSAQM